MKLYERTIDINIGHVTFMDSKSSYGYDLGIVSKDENAILFLDLKTAHASQLEGI